MKKIVMLLILAVVSIGTYAQTGKGDTSFGLTFGGGFEDINHVTVGIDFRYNLTYEVRLSPSITHFIKNDNLSAWAIDMNAHYVVPLSGQFGFYPLAGLNLSFWKYEVDNIPIPGYSKLTNDFTRVGANIGLGGELYASDEITLGLEVKYLIAKDVSQPMVGLRIGYNF